MLTTEFVARAMSKMTTGLAVGPAVGKLTTGKLNTGIAVNKLAV
jgi:hypothetical protein